MRAPAFRTVLAGALLAALFGCSDAGDERPPAPEGAWNVVLISIDSLRADRLGCYGHTPEFAPEVAVSPHLDALAADGVLFESAYSTSSWTLPSHMALLTGTSDRAHGVEQTAFRLDPEMATLAERLYDAGWSTAGCFSGPLLDPKYGFARGFERYESAMIPPEEVEAAIAARMGVPVEQLDGAAGSQDFYLTMRKRLHRLDVSSPRVNRFAERFLDERDEDRPFFLFLHYFDVHHDYVPERADPELARRFDPDYDGELSGEGWLYDERVRKRTSRGYERAISERDLAHVKAMYDAEIHWVDRHVGELVASLRQRGLLEKTVVAVVSDHGEEFFEHGGITHGTTLHEELLRIPMILRVPGDALRGIRSQEIARLYDLEPTLLARLGVDAGPVEGRDLLAAADGPAPGALARRIAGEVGGGMQILDAWRDERFAVLRFHRLDAAAAGDERVVPLRGRDGTPVLRVYDRRDDPDEHHPLDPSDPRYAAALAAFCRDFDEAESFAESLPRSPLADRRAPSLGAAEQALLEELGYAGDAAEEHQELREPLGRFPRPCSDE